MENKTTVKQWIYQVIQPYKYKIVFLCIITALLSILNLLNAVLLKSIIDVAVDKNKDLIMRYSLLLGAIIVITIITLLFKTHYKEKLIYTIDHYLQHRVFSNLLDKDFSEVADKHTEYWLTRIRSDSTNVATQAVSLLPSIVDIIISVVGTAFLIIKTAPSFFPLVLMGVIVVVILNIVFKEPLKQAQRETQQAISERNVYLSEALSHLMIVKAFCREKIVSLGTQKTLDNLFIKKVKKLRFLLVKKSLHNISSKLALFLVIVYCAFNIYNNRLSYGTCVMLLRLLSQISAPLTEISNRFASIFDFIVGVERLQEAENLPKDSEVVPKSEEEIRKYYDESFKEIVIKDASFSYTNRNNTSSDSTSTVFSHINLSIPKQSTIAITGMTGSGKSTLFKILLSLYHLESGSKLLRNIDNSEIELDASWRGLFAYVPQGHQLMTGSIRDAITFGSVVDNSRDEDIMKAAEVACASEFINKLPDGLDTQIRKGGLGLSEGQLQRIAIARAIFTNRPILLLDEATSALDGNTELELIEHLKTLTNCTTIIVTHRPAALSICEYNIHIDGENIFIEDLREKAS